MALRVMKQLKVEEAEYSKLSPLMYTTNRLKYRLLKKKGYNI